MRKIERVFKTVPTLEGAGVHLKRGFSNREAEQFDSFLLFDDFSNSDEDAYKKGFPLHPHRGIETVTYILKGEVHHKDSMGNEGSISAGDVQWMTSGSGILHEEMPVVHDEGIQGFQLWVNLPKKDKMMHSRYQEIKAKDIPVVSEEGRDVKVIAGEYKGTKGPVQDLMVAPTYLDVKLSAYIPFTTKIPREDVCFVYVIEGRLAFRDDRTEVWVGEGEIGLLTKESELMCNGGKDGARFLLVAGTPLNESISWAGPIVMNTQAELDTAFKELNNGTFIKR